MRLLVHQAALGDWVLTFPLLRAIAAREPLACVTSAGKAQLASEWVGNIQPVDADSAQMTRLFVDGDDRPAPMPLKELFGRVEGVISFVSSGRDAWARNVDRLAPGAWRAFVMPRPGADWRGHVADWHREQLRAQGMDFNPIQPPARCNEQGPVIIHPGSGGREKRWPVERFCWLADTLRDRGYDVRLVLGEVEADCWPAPLVSSLRHHYQTRVLHNLTDLARELASARLYIGNDSGPTHLAAQLGLPTIAMFGPSDLRRWAPRGPQVHLLAPDHPAPMTWLRRERALEACEQMISP